MIPFIDLKAQYARIEGDVRARMDAVLAHGRFIMGPEVAELEEGLARFAGSGHCVTCSSGTDALLMALMAQGIGPGDAVFTSPFTFIATAEVITLLGATPIFVDIDPATFNLDPDRLDQAVAALVGRDPSAHPLPSAALDGAPLRPAMVIPVDLFGLPADYDEIHAVAAKHGLAVLADAAQSFGAEYGGRRAVTCARAAATSFFPAKPLGCFGDGGAVFTDDATLAETCRSLRVHGKGGHKYDNVRTGLNARLDTLQAAVLLAKLAVFPDELDERRAVADGYAERLGDVPDLTLPTVPPDRTCAWAQYTVRHAAREAIQAALREAGVPTAVYYPCPLHLQTAFAGLGYSAGDFPAAEAASNEVFSLPMSPYVTPPTLDVICDALKDAVRGVGA
ncbi:DegT/DnrJ/EryC1/StrS aminotransferase [Pseudodesulfovibrio mercurii]|uniref:DegT/DnrJ/EryC1/StrS aminotransferase n=1 Tax=Pseudodesulfovibrio mercurii TaxID=641491 RepID=F0JC58_9BACT|nr:DegT/DnrJ/EryC1/StrS family aminotransferase [Pseudodesulfovibrio mercurii]EGB15631.1 DegT/DnrJ/EryC1/StrS aminotransferase [Pseudodesulfovibrio mercurii]